MQTFKAKTHLFGLLLLLMTACAGPERLPVLPTPLMMEEPTAVHPTPTLQLSDTAVVSNSRSLGDPYIPELGNTGYDVQHYTLQLALDPAVSRVQGTTIIQAKADIDELAQLSLDFIGFEIGQVRVDGVSTTFNREDGKLIVDLPQPLAAGTMFEIAVDYAGEPARESSAYVGFIESLGLQFVNGQTIYALAEPDGARYWFPANDHPRDKALFRFEITVPMGLTAVANGRLIAAQNNAATNTFIWEHDHLMATYLALIAVGPYERIDAVSPGGVPLRHYAFADLDELTNLDGSGDLAASRADFEAAIAISGEAIDWMGQLFGPYPFETFGYVAADVPGASMETQTMVLLSSNMTGQQTAVHEMAHMWFGDWVSLDSWQEMWRNEGFATYVTMMWNNRDDPEGLELEIEAALAAVAENGPQYALGNPPAEHLFGYNTYFGGAALVHALRQEMGDEAFFAGLRTYFQRYGGGAASDADFQAVMEEAAGISLAVFFAEGLGK